MKLAFSVKLNVGRRNPRDTSKSTSMCAKRGKNLAPCEQIGSTLYQGHQSIIHSRKQIIMGPTSELGITVSK